MARNLNDTITGYQKTTKRMASRLENQMDKRQNQEFKSSNLYSDALNT